MKTTISPNNSDQGVCWLMTRVDAGSQNVLHPHVMAYCVLINYTDTSTFHNPLHV